MYIQKNCKKLPAAFSLKRNGQNHEMTALDWEKRIQIFCFFIRRTVSNTANKLDRWFSHCFSRNAYINFFLSKLQERSNKPVMTSIFSGWWCCALVLVLSIGRQKYSDVVFKHHLKKLISKHGDPITSKRKRSAQQMLNGSIWMKLDSPKIPHITHQRTIHRLLTGGPWINCGYSWSLPLLSKHCFGNSPFLVPVRKEPIHVCSGAAWRCSLC